jgi:hypothetical protein
MLRIENEFQIVAVGFGLSKPYKARRSNYEDNSRVISRKRIT